MSHTFWRNILLCPRDKLCLHQEDDALVCERGHRYAETEGVPILLVSEAEQTRGKIGSRKR